MKHMKQISSAVPADIAERLADNDIGEFSKADLRDAQLEIEEELVAGERVGKLDLEAVLDEELNRNYAATLRNLYEHFAGIASCGCSAERCLNADAWMLRLVRSHITEEMVEERAAKIAADRLEDAS